MFCISLDALRLQQSRRDDRARRPEKEWGEVLYDAFYDLVPRGGNGAAAAAAGGQREKRTLLLPPLCLKILLSAALVAINNDTAASATRPGQSRYQCLASKAN